MGLLRRITNTFRPARLNREFDEELEFHRQMRLRKSSEDETRRRMGSRLLAKEQMRDARVIGWLLSSLQDLRHGVTLLRRDAGVSALIVLVLALGIGGNAAVFTLLKAAFLDPLPYRDAGRLVTILENSGWIPSTSAFLEIRARNRTLDQLAFAEHRDMQLAGNGEPAHVFAARVTASFFRLLGSNAALGRTFLDEENQPGRPQTVVLSHAFWQSRMGADPAVVGRTLRLDGAPATVVGVLPPGFHFDYPTLRIQDPVDLYVAYPVVASPKVEVSANGRGVPVRVVGRLRQGVTLAQAQDDLRRVARMLTREQPESFPNPQNDPSLFSFVVVPLRKAIVGPQRSLLWLFGAGVGILLLIACANTAQLLLARSLRRGREIAVRSALGASRARLVRQFLLEGLVLAACGGAAGLLVAGGIARLVIGLLPSRNPVLAAARLDWRAVGFTLVVSLVSAIAFAVLPALKGSRWVPGPSLSARVATGEGNRWRHAMVAIEAALSVFLLCGAGLVARNLWTLVSTPVGFDPDHVLAMRLTLPGRKQSLPDVKAGAVFREYLERVRAIPGVESAATVTGPPLRPARGSVTEVADANGVRRRVITWVHQISPDYFRSLGIPLLAGRAFRDSDVGTRITVAVVNEEYARQFGLGENVVGRQIPDPDGPITIVGMVGNVRARALDAESYPEMYLSSGQFSWTNVYLLVRSPLPPAQLLRQVKTAIASSNSDQSVYGVVTMKELIADSVAEPRFHVCLIGAFALLALGMAASGMYSVISCLISQRTSEIAIRMALGADRGDIARIVLGTTTAWLAAGLGCGLGLGLATQSAVRSLSGAAVGGSPGMYVSVVVFFFAITLAAAWLPARRACRLDPAAALRSE